MKERVRVFVIAAMCKNRGIGLKNRLPWHLAKEMAYFRSITKHTLDESKMNAVIMGRLTWESIPAKFRPMAGRLNFVISRNKDYSVPDGVHVVSSIDDAVSVIEKPEHQSKIENVWILGGEQIYRQAIESQFCHRLYLTHIDASYECDTFFPKFSIGTEPGQFRDITYESDDDRVPKGVQEENGTTYEVKIFERI